MVSDVRISLHNACVNQNLPKMTIVIIEILPEDGIRIVGFTLRLKIYVKSPPFLLDFFRAGAAIGKTPSVYHIPHSPLFCQEIPSYRGQNLTFSGPFLVIL